MKVVVRKAENQVQSGTNDILADATGLHKLLSEKLAQVCIILK